LKKSIPIINAADMRHAVVTERSAALRAIFPWGFSTQKILHAVRPSPFTGGHLFVGSDYGGDHKRSSYKTYAFVVADDTPSEWMSLQKAVRTRYLTDGRRMSFKRLGDPQRQAALIPFLRAADSLSGHLIAFVVHKSIRLHPSDDLKRLRELFALSANWNHGALEQAIRKAHFFALIVSQWTKPLMDVTWISDQDEFVANEKRLDDAQRIAAQLSSLYLPHTLREFAMNTTAIDDSSREYEDLIAISDLSAGTLAELSSTLGQGTSWSDLSGRHELRQDGVQLKSSIITDWFWEANSTLRRTCIVIDKVGKQSRIFKLDMLNG
jgi:hypothetical protein